MKIHELSKQSGIHLETIRYYEKMGLMPEPKRLANGYRDYDEASLKQLKFIKTCRALDFSLAEIKFFNEMKRSNLNIAKWIACWRSIWFQSKKKLPN